MPFDTTTRGFQMLTVYGQLMINYTASFCAKKIPQKKMPSKYSFNISHQELINVFVICTFVEKDVFYKYGLHSNMQPIWKLPNSGYTCISCPLKLLEML